MSEPSLEEQVRAALPRTSLPLDAEAVAFYVDALREGSRFAAKDEPPISFTAGVLALLNDAEGLRKWFGKQAEQAGPNASLVRAGESARLRSGKPAAPLGSDGLVARPWPDPLLTISSRGVLATANEWATSANES